MQDSGFFNSIDGDRLYSADDFSHFYGLFFTDGVISLPEESLKCTAGEGLSVNIAAGEALIKSHYFRHSEESTVELETAHDTYPRIDLIVVKYDNTDTGRKITLEAKTGVPAQPPQPPALERNDDVYELAIAVAGIAAGATTISSFRDTRSEENYCGFVKSKFAIDGVPQPDTGTVPYGTIVPVIGGNFNAPAGAYEEA